jgi:flagellar biosynthesis protein FlhF
MEAGELAAQAAALGARCFIATRLDAARRLGALIAAADLGGLAFADAGASPFVGKGFERLDALGLAHRLLADPDALAAEMSAAAGEATTRQPYAAKPASPRAAE